MCAHELFTSNSRQIKIKVTRTIPTHHSRITQMEILDVIPFVDVELNQDSMEKVISKVVKIIRPDWDGSEWTNRILTKGLLNTTILCSTGTENAIESNNTLVFRCCNEIFCGSMDEQKRIVTFLDANGLSPKLLAFFRNGICMQYIVGEDLNWFSPRVYDNDVWMSLAETMALWHCRDVYNSAVQAKIRRTTFMGVDVSKLFDKLVNSEPFLQVSKDFPTAKMLVDEEQRIIDSIDHLTPALCHTDINSANIIMTPKGVQLIDFDFTGISYCQFELAWFFRSFNEIKEPSDDIPGKEWELKYIRHYLQRRNDLDRTSNVTSDEVTLFFHQVQKSKLVIDLRSISLQVYMHSFMGKLNYEDIVRNIKKLWVGFNEHKRKLFAEN